MQYRWLIGALCVIGALGGCGPALIGDYVVRTEIVEYGGVKDNEVFIGRCDRTENTGELKNCRRLQIKFEE
jgi:hypothetical protein